MSAETGGEQATVENGEQVRMKTDAATTTTMHRPNHSVDGFTMCGCMLFDSVTMSRDEAERLFNDVRECQAPACYGDPQ